MKLKYYLRGLATGIVLATLILTIADPGEKPLTDAQIRQRAAQLGMVESDSLRLSALQNSTAQPGDGGAGSKEAQGSPEVQNNEPQYVQSGEEGQSAAQSAESSTAGSQGAAVQITESGEQGPVVIEIYSGASSYTVSQTLAAAGLVEDAKRYDTYLCDNGYAQKIRAGTYKILPGTSEEEITRMIAH